MENTAQIHWEYPLFLIAHGGGYTSIVDPKDTDDQPQHILTTHSSEGVALEFMQQFAIVGEPRKLNDDREFRWLLKSLKLPVTKVAYDPRPVELDVNARWIASIRTLLDQHLVIDNSPWRYPVFIIDHGDGYGSTAGQDQSGKSITLLNLFTTEEQANEYLRGQKRQGNVFTLHNMAHVRDVLSALRDSVTAVAVDPVYESAGSSSQYCISVDALLEKYLVIDS